MTLPTKEELGLPWRTYKCSYCDKGCACGIHMGCEEGCKGGYSCSFDQSYDECHHPMDEASVDFLCMAANMHHDLVGMLRSLQWGGPEGLLCDVCGGSPSRGHSPACPIGALLDKVKGEA